MYYSENNSGGWQLLEEHIDDDFDEMSGFDPNRHMQYVWGVRYIDDIVLRRQDSNLDDTLDKTWYHCTDTLFSTVAILDHTAKLVERVSYDAYGNARHHRMGDLNGDGAVDISDQLLLFGAWGDGGVGDLNRDGASDVSDLLLLQGSWGPAQPAGRISAGSSGTDNIIGYAGYVFNPEMHGSGLYTVRYRVYDPELGRWLTRDPIGYVDGMGLYEYVGSSPVRWLDPLGLKKKKNKPSLPYTPGDDVFEPVDDPCKACPDGQQKVVVILGDVNDGWWDVMVPRIWRMKHNRDVKRRRDLNQNVDDYPDGVSRRQFQDIVKDPCVVEIVFIGHSASRDDSFPSIKVGPGDDDWIFPSDVRRWRNPCSELERVLFRSCNQGTPNNRDDWQDAFDLEPSKFIAPDYFDRWFYRSPSPGELE